MNKTIKTKPDILLVVVAVIVFSMIVTSRVVLDKKNRIANKIINIIKASDTIDMMKD